ncbi:hypothetical protein BD413DRAFT_157425 [Trametes elegans]|nr:hypothetical protein BD413DRAFT_157425 [Trametes elegans]
MSSYEPFQAIDRTSSCCAFLRIFMTHAVSQHPLLSSTNCLQMALGFLCTVRSCLHVHPGVGCSMQTALRELPWTEFIGCFRRGCASAHGQRAAHLVIVSRFRAWVRCYKRRCTGGSL